MSRRRDPHTKNLFDWEADPVAIGYEGDVAGRGSVSNKISRLVSRALRDAKDAGLQRADVCRKMAEYLGRPVPSGAMDKWSSEAADDRCIPLDWFIGLVHATGQHELLGFIPALFGFAVVPDRFVELIELHQIREHKAEVEAREKALEAKVRSRR